MAARLAPVARGGFCRRAAGLPYRLHGHGDLFAARVVREVLAYLRLAINPADRLALARIVDIPPRGLGRLAATLLDEPATAAELPGRADDFGPAAVASAATLMAAIFDLHAEASRGAAPVALLDRALDRSGYRAWLVLDEELRVLYVAFTRARERSWR
jgi:DNA helicase-2/ATP-dependent DNA helicase PcrA